MSPRIHTSTTRLDRVQHCRELVNTVSYAHTNLHIETLSTDSIQRTRKLTRTRSSAQGHSHAKTRIRQHAAHSQASSSNQAITSSDRSAHSLKHNQTTDSIQRFRSFVITQSDARGPAYAQTLKHTTDSKPPACPLANAQSHAQKPPHTYRNKQQVTWTAFAKTRTHSQTRKRIRTRTNTNTHTTGSKQRSRQLTNP